MTTTREPHAEMPPVTSPEQAARILGVALTADPSALRTAFRVAARQAHPDAGGSATQFAHVRSAYELLLWQRQQDAQGTELPVRVHRGVVVWVRQGKPRPVVMALLQAGALVGTALTLGGALLVSTAGALAMMLLVRAFYIAAGLPPASPTWWRQQWDRRRQVRHVEDWPTGPIPVMTEERIRQYERTGR